MSVLPLSLLLDTAVRAAKAAGDHAFQNKNRRSETSESFCHDVKLVMDVECQKIAEALILSEFPEHGILGEEDSSIDHNSDYEWIIDPIDGTVNYFHGFAYWCCSIAVRKHEKVLAGCVYAPEFNACYTAHADGPALLNGVPTQVSTQACLKNSIVFTGLSKYMESDPDAVFGTFNKLALNTRKLRINGSAALDLCHIADGICDGYFEGHLYLWDYAAAGLIAERAGAVVNVSPLDGEPHAAVVLSSNPTLANDLKEIWNTSPLSINNFKSKTLNSHHG
ncbi:MAG TPA: inositol monophosphatase family protein [Pontiella sp.]